MIGAALLASVTLAFVVAPLVAGTALGGWWEWAAVFAGVALGWLVALVLRRVATVARETALPARAAFAQR